VNPSLARLFQVFKGLSTLQLALGVSIGVHAALLTVRFVDPERFNRIFMDTPLEVVLVNARTNEQSEKAQALAQASLAGGGEAATGLASSPLPPSAFESLGDSFEDEQRKIEAMQARQNLMVAQLKEQIARLPVQSPTEVAQSSDAAAKEEKRRQLVKLLAEIERRIQEQNARPKKRYISPATREVPYALYYDNLRRKIEEKGTENFPELAGQKMYGELVVSITVDRTGRMLNAQVEQSSGNATLDRRALAITKAASPFGQFTSGMAAGEQIVVVSQFKFTRDETLETKLMKQQ
jgi:periplasmic protein TonB